MSQHLLLGRAFIILLLLVEAVGGWKGRRLMLVYGEGPSLCGCCGRGAAQ